MRNREDSEDALQDCLLNAFAHVKDFDERSRFATWLSRIATNAALAKLHRNRRKREIAMDEPTRHPSPDGTGRFKMTLPIQKRLFAFVNGDRF